MSPSVARWRPSCLKSAAEVTRMNGLSKAVDVSRILSSAISLVSIVGACSSSPIVERPTTESNALLDPDPSPGPDPNTSCQAVLPGYSCALQSKICPLSGYRASATCHYVRDGLWVSSSGNPMTCTCDSKSVSRQDVGCEMSSAGTACAGWTTNATIGIHSAATYGECQAELDQDCFNSCLGPAPNYSFCGATGVPGVDAAVQ
jgi:hypothetical protein